MARILSTGMAASYPGPKITLTRSGAPTAAVTPSKIPSPPRPTIPAVKSRPARLLSVTARWLMRGNSACESGCRRLMAARMILSAPPKNATAWGGGEQPQHQGVGLIIKARGGPKNEHPCGVSQSLNGVSESGSPERDLPVHPGGKPNQGCRLRNRLKGQNPPSVLWSLHPNEHPQRSQDLCTGIQCRGGPHTFQAQEIPHRAEPAGHGKGAGPE